MRLLTTLLSRFEMEFLAGSSNKLWALPLLLNQRGTLILATYLYRLLSRCTYVYSHIFLLGHTVGYLFRERRLSHGGFMESELDKVVSREGLSMK